MNVKKLRSSLFPTFQIYNSFPSEIQEQEELQLATENFSAEN